MLPEQYHKSRYTHSIVGIHLGVLMRTPKRERWLHRVSHQEDSGADNILMNGHAFVCDIYKHFAC